MKKYFLTLLALSPIPLFAQSYGSSGDFGGLAGLVVGILIFVLIFLALREVMTWYWKINAIIQNQEKIVQLLENQKFHSIERSKVEDKHNNYMESNIYSIKEHLTKIA